MKYPYIGKWEKINTTVIFTDKDAGIEIGGEMKYRNDWTEMFYENITAEYLANTYGEVKSKEHAEFIVKLCKNAGIDTESMNSYRVGSPFFNIYKEGDVMYLAFWDKESVCVTEGEKQITIPFPLECEEKPKTALSKGRVYELCDDGNYLHISNPDGSVNNMRFDYKNLENLKKASDFKVVSDDFVETEITDEWPKVGSNVEWGHTGKGEVKSLSDGFAWIKLDNKDYTTVYVSSLRKPKTPEQELNDELYELCLTHCESKFQASEIARKLTQEYNITKKPQ